MPEFRVVFETPHGEKAKRVKEQNVTAAVNRVLQEWERVYLIKRIDLIVQTEAGEERLPDEFDIATTEQHIHINVKK